ncbi:endo-1,4-beta-xylanase [Patescibacteria group bacterium]|nr:endo-1,4-beta-xylanase [Patescibacteria group bacterium]
MTKFRSALKTLIVLIFSFIILIFLGEFVFNSTYQFPSKIEYGVTFSPGYASSLKLDWKKTYVRILDELEVRNLRVPGYWDVVEKDQGKYDFSEVDFMLDEAGRSGAKVILVLGEKQPRWPECQIPTWAKSLKLQDRQQRLLEFIQRTVEKYKDHPAVWAWQVENEPFLPFFGENCDPGDEKFLKTEINLVKSLSNKTIIVSDAGEPGAWIVPMQTSDVFGTTLYRTVYNPVIGYFSFPFLPYLYNIKSQIVRIFAPNNQKTIIVELQAEPWLSGGDLTRNLNKQLKQFPSDKMKSYLDYARKTGFDEIYLWGVEWWYFMAYSGYPEYLQYAETLFR